jgi:hypothetical protein
LSRGDIGQTDGKNGIGKKNFLVRSIQEKSVNRAFSSKINQRAEWARQINRALIKMSVELAAEPIQYQQMASRMKSIT